MNFRDNLELLTTLFPGRATISPKEAATAMGADVGTIYDAMRRVHNPLPSVKLSPKKIVIPVAQLASWMSLRR